MRAIRLISRVGRERNRSEVGTDEHGEPYPIMIDETSDTRKGEDREAVTIKDSERERERDRGGGKLVLPMHGLLSPISRRKTPTMAASVCGVNAGMEERVERQGDEIKLNLIISWTILQFDKWANLYTYSSFIGSVFC